MRTILKIAGAAATLALAFSPAANAQSGFDGGYLKAEGPAYYGPVLGYGNVRPACRPWCAQDYAPCDPPNFKTADRRCNGNH